MQDSNTIKVLRMVVELDNGNFLIYGGIVPDASLDANAYLAEIDKNNGTIIEEIEFVDNTHYQTDKVIKKEIYRFRA